MIKDLWIIVETGCLAVEENLWEPESCIKIYEGLSRIIVLVIQGGPWQTHFSSM